MLLSDGRHGEALEALSAARRIGPDSPVVSEFEGHVLRELGRPEDALDAYVRSRTLNSRHQPGWRGETLTLLELGRIREAEKAAKVVAHLGDGGLLDLVRSVKAAGTPHSGRRR